MPTDVGLEHKKDAAINNIKSVLKTCAANFNCHFRCGRNFKSCDAVYSVSVVCACKHAFARTARSMNNLTANYLHFGLVTVFFCVCSHLRVAVCVCRVDT